MSSSQQYRPEGRALTLVGMGLCLGVFAALGHNSNGKGRSERGISCCQWNFSTKPAREGDEVRAVSKDRLNGFDGERQYPWICEWGRVASTA